MNTQTPFFILSADRVEYGEDINADRRNMLERQLTARDVEFHQVQGSYNGLREVSYVVFGHDSRTESVVFQLARRYGQDSVLSVDANRLAILIYLHPGMGGPDVRRTEVIGQWRTLSTGEPLPQSYTTVNGASYTTAALS